METTENTELDIDVEDIGTILKSSRLKSKKTLEEISSELCIRKIYLTALEEGDYETLPPIPYGIGYIRTYAQYLGLSPERAVKLYKAASVVEEQPKPEEDAKEPEVNKSNKWHVIIGIILLTAIYGLLNSCNHEDAIKKDLSLQEEVISTEAVEDTIADTTIDENKTEPEETKEEAENESEETLDADDKSENKAESEPIINKENIVLLFKGESWIEIKDRNKIYIQGVFHKGDMKEIKYAKNMFITVGRPQNIKIYINGVEKDILAKRRKSNIPLDSLK